jgi:hypothetical protein
MASNAKHLQNKSLLRPVEETTESANPSGRVVLTPARRRELIRETVEEYRETLDILARYDREHSAEDPTN